MERSLKKKYWADQAKKSVLLIPALVLLLAFFIIPIVLTVYYSFTNMALTGAAAQNFQFIGLENYKRILSDPNTLVSIRNTFIFLIGSLVGQSVLGFLIAYFMKGKAKAFRSVVGPCILAGWVMPEIVVSLCCLAFFDVSGTFNKIIGTLHIPGVDFIYGHPMMTIIIANVWHGTAFSMLNFQSALDNVSGDIEEAARVDGANRIQTLVRIIVPCIKDTIATNTMLNTLSTLGVFGLIWALTGGGPGMSTTTLPIYMYNQGLKNFQLGQGTAVGMILLFVGAVCSIIYTRLLKSDD
ncbi:sugar ABC transporter permease [Ruminococcus sp. AF37-6AT]|jgi:multiple sugar transport system permease protein|uniref:carbohydrate ABC transporter permease n=1 Tax=Blautia sp. HCN-1074 TaxID=3134667 RepID=UPI000E42E873|nr:sugar ABC transporter permease [uncultured Blautia sp.]RGI61277.1 sugar ABC transporter permease [Ruminococcus sp. TM10-9AT]RGW19599.1 sugar ABC transporter permease [Ruminococcus sp. AF13-37]RGW21382.1 sugar ABC transporter permease [Ruminococcus sp. AF13-28]RGY91125.1 sugar ABC transporter permease [Ruminococcus sp. AM58-7XD]RHG56222.1 sugar ABC transporter permease [Ruminococcus sp. AM22-13]RHJ98614.1 sugar ABC transporter permease [Ruminococcus sp. AM07-21]RHL50009.1 sugar ABC transpo